MLILLVSLKLGLELTYRMAKWKFQDTSYIGKTGLQLTTKKVEVRNTLQVAEYDSLNSKL